MKPSWEDCNVWTQALLIAYDQTRQHEELENQQEMLKATQPKPTTGKGRRRR